MRKVFLFIASVLLTVSLMAAEFQVDGIYYSTLTSNTVQVVKPTSGKYTDDITIPATVFFGQTYQVVAIGDDAFKGANQVTSVTLPLLGITSIGSFAFNDCTGLTSFMLPASITSIGERAFYFCDNLHDLYVCATDPAAYNPGNMAFSKIHYGSHKCTLHVPTGCTAAYAADPTFSVFTQVEEFDPPQPVLYDIYVAGTQVTEYNASDILGEWGSVSYDAETKTLTLDGANIVASGATDMEDTGIYIGEEDVTIVVAGSSYINASNEGIYLTKGTNIIGSAQLTIDAHYGSAIYMENNSLTIDGADLVLSSYYGGISGAGANTMTIKSSTITATADPYYSAPALGGGWQDVQLIDCYIELPEGGKYDPEKGVVDKNDVPAQDASIKPGVAPVFYDIYVKGIHVSDQNASDILEDGTVSYSAGTKTLTLNGAYIGASGETDMEDTGIYIGEEDVTILVIGESTITSNYNGIHFTKDATITGSEQLSIDDHMGSCIAMYNNSLTIDGANLVLSSEFGGLTGAGANTLTIKSSTITATADHEYSSNPALGGKWQDVQLVDCYIELPEGGKYDPEKGVVDKNDDIAYNVSIKPGVAPVLYDIYIAGTRVTEDNASDILEDSTVSYSAGTKTLTLNGAYIFANGATDLENTGIYVGEEDVTIEVVSASTIYDCEYGIYFTKDATITGSEQLIIINSPDNAIRMSENSLTIDGANLNLASNNETLKGVNANTLTIKSSTITASSEFSLVSAIGGSWQDVQLIDCYIELPEGGKYDLMEGGVVDKNGDLAQEVRIKRTPGTSLEDIVVPADKAQKVLMDGILYIIRPDGKVYTLQGQEVK